MWNHRAESDSLSGLALLGGIGLGAGLMYVFDPDRGRRRRAMAQQKAYRLLRLSGDALDKGLRDLEHRTQGAVAEVLASVRGGPVSDEVLEQRVRARLGRVASHPGSIAVTAQDGHVVLSGPVLAGEPSRIMEAASSVRGVRDVESRLDEQGPEQGIPGIQGAALRRSGQVAELLQENWAPGTRLVMGGLALGLLIRGLRSRGILGSASVLLGLGLLARSARRSRLSDEVAEAARPSPSPRAGRQPRERRTRRQTAETGAESGVA